MIPTHYKVLQLQRGVKNDFNGRDKDYVWHKNSSLQSFSVCNIGRTQGVNGRVWVRLRMGWRWEVHFNTSSQEGPPPLTCPLTSSHWRITHRPPLDHTTSVSHWCITPLVNHTGASQWWITARITLDHHITPHFYSYTSRMGVSSRLSHRCLLGLVSWTIRYHQILTTLCRSWKGFDIMYNRKV